MPRNRLTILGFLLSIALATPAAAEEVAGMHWQQDLDSAAADAAQSGRLLLVHFWTPSCGPCRMLDRNVFSQPNVAHAIEAQFVPVKLNAHEHPELTQQLGVTRVPTDVVLSTEGDVIGKFISPTTPTAYVSEVIEMANHYASRSGGAFDEAVAAAAQPPVNSAYANLPVKQPEPPAAERPAVSVEDRYGTSTQTTSNQVANPYATGATSQQMASANTDRYQTAQPSQATDNPYAQPPQPPTAPQQSTVSRQTVTQQPQPQPNVVDNRYAQSQPQQYTTQPYSAQQAPPRAAPTQPATPPAAPQYYTAAPPQQQAPPTVQYTQNRPAAPAASQQAANAPQQNNSTVLSDGRQLPPGAPPLGFDGYCPVTMRSDWKWVKGDPAYGAIHRGRTYWFAGPQQQQAFLANPDLYGPALSGIDPVVAFDQQQAVSGKREHSLDYDNQFYLFSSEESLNAFVNNPERYATGVRQAMNMSTGGRIIR